MSKLIVLGTGLGSRCYPLTVLRPKGLLPVKLKYGKFSSLVNYQVTSLLHNNPDIISEVVIASYKDHVHEYKLECGEIVKYVNQELGYKLTVHVLEIPESLKSCNNAKTMEFISSKMSLSDSFILENDVMYKIENDFRLDNENYQNQQSFIYTTQRSNEWELVIDSSGKVTGVNTDSDGLCMMGLSYIGPNVDNHKLSVDLAQACDSQYWDSIFIHKCDPYAVHDPKLFLMYEFDTVQSYMMSHVRVSNEMLAHHMSMESARKLGGLSNDNYLVKWPKGRFVIQFTDQSPTRDTAYQSITNYTYHVPLSLSTDLKAFPYMRIVPYLESYGTYDFSVNPTIDIYATSDSESNSNDITVAEYLFSVINFLITNVHTNCHSNELDMTWIYDNLESWTPCTHNTSDLLFRYMDTHKLSVLLTKLLSTTPQKSVLVHGDLVPGNIMFDQTNRDVILIDYEYSQVSTPYWDLASLLTELVVENPTGFQDVIPQLFSLTAKYYSQHSSFDIDLKLLYGWAAFINYYWSLWKIPENTKSMRSYLQLRKELGDKFYKMYQEVQS